MNRDHVSMASMHGIQVRGLRKTFRIRTGGEGKLAGLRRLVSRQFRDVHAVNGIDFDIEPGELVGYLGPNGAGKSTTLKILTGILVPSSGEVNVAGFVPWQDRRSYTQHIGVVFGQRSNLWWDLPLIESYEIMRHIYEIPAERYDENLKLFKHLLGLDAFLYTPVRQISLGQRMRADLAAALMHDPKILFLDEPTIGLDVAVRDAIRSFIREINRERGVTVILTTHDMHDVEKLCRRVILIAQGKGLYDGSLAGLRSQFGPYRELLVDFDLSSLPSTPGSSQFGSGDPRASAAPEVPSVDNAELISIEGRRAIYRFHRDQVSASTLIQDLAGRSTILDLTVREPEIEDLVRRFYAENEGEV